ncbi:MAG: muramidase [Candidatus Thiodiazotropha sp. (ex Lucinoma aequizonata)]|nr:muramidase [Candidatus Thiodiazotropha sp. (ex Lucinoma aequizonata)]MCU7887398.1 muramidase [Candidatus Thiodiazotropha sp. (ex Lucinoma aequizonata)]MCU7894002.1 muramidase [Candidatus Thiodiazotropha sp. (ex Lucinoma aequizonata)]MCU7898761.1 muramidase [Candidatus Thiodiazotropha sp. (ex Lucinoma aequizonata)]MCU7901459.1 muramidase [Candidatus Thiodiazotropha sp. (ex Lucinoma aequizonata)]
MLPFIADMPSLEQERVVCSISPAVKYEVPAKIVLAMAEKEGGSPGQRVRNSNGTHDVGPMQFNSAYLGDLEKYGIITDDMAASGCYSFDLAAWRLRGHILHDSGDIWTRAANYHSRTPKYNTIYRADLMQKAVKWADWLDEHFSTVNVTAQGGAAPGNGTAMQQVIQEATKIEANGSYRQTERQGEGSYTPNQQTGYVLQTITFQTGAGQ